MDEHERGGAPEQKGAPEPRHHRHSHRPASVAPDLPSPLDDDEARAAGRRIIAQANALGANGASPGDDDGDGEHCEADDGDALDDESAAPGRRNKSVATQLVELAERYYALGCSCDGLAFGVDTEGPNVARPLRAGRLGLRAALANAYLYDTGRVPASGALADALVVIEGRCQHAQPVDLFHRVAPFGGGGLAVDLGDADGRAVVIEPGAGWKVVERSPVPFRRSELTMPLPEPQRGGVDLLAEPLANISPRCWPLVVGWLVAALIPKIPHPILLLRGEQGVGKTTAATTLGTLIDPTAAPVRSTPRDLEQWAVTANGSWLVAMDNLSGVAPWLSDALCRAVTGEGLVRRKLYSDDDVSVLAFRRLILLTAIDAGALRGDLADRLIAVDLDRIGPADRRTDADLAERHARRLPALLGALYDLAADVLAALPTVALPELPRMADFARILAAVEAVRPCDATPPLALYLGLQQELARDVVEGDPFAAAVSALARAQGTWRGTATTLADSISAPDPRPKDWPRTPRAVGGALRRVAPALRAVGVTVEHVRSVGSGSQREIILRADTEPAP